MSQVTCYDSYGRKINHFTQWDMNVTISIPDWEFDIKPVFHFANRSKYSEKPFNVAGSDVTMVTEDDGSKTVTSKVPNALLEVNEPIKVYVFLVDSNSVGETVFEINIPVYPKAKPDDYEFEENVHPISLESLEAEMIEMVNDAKALVLLEIAKVEQEYHDKQDALELAFATAVTNLQNMFKDGTPKGMITPDNIDEFVENNPEHETGIYLIAGFADSEEVMPSV